MINNNPHHKPGYSWYSRQTYSQKTLAPFQMIGQLQDATTTPSDETNNKPVAPDIFDALGTLTPNAYELFLKFKWLRDHDTNKVQYVTPKARPESARFAKLIIQLKKAHIVKRYKVNGFMLNPAFIRCKENDMATVRWDNL